jgi:serine/threonine protein kinase
MMWENARCSEGERALTFWAKLATLYVEKDAHMSYIDKEIGNYRIKRRIANGSFGTAYLAEHLHLPRTVVIKILHGIHLDSDEEKEQFRQEAHILDMLQDSNISNVLHLLDFGIEGDVPYMIMEYAEQGSLRMRMQRRRGPLPLQEALKIIEQVGKGLQSAHDKRIVHRDLKPENILFNAEGEALLADFGIAIVLKTASVKRTHIVGTPAYMAPEQFRGEVCKESDQYALACIAYELLTSHKLFEVQDIHAWSHHHLHESPISPCQHNPQIPASVEDALLKALEKDRSKRYRSVSEFVTALTAHNGPPPPPPPSGVPPRPKPRPSRRFLLLACGALALLAILLLSLSVPLVINHFTTQQPAGAFQRKNILPFLVCTPLLRCISSCPISLEKKAWALLALAFVAIRLFGWPKTVASWQHSLDLQHPHAPTGSATTELEQSAKNIDKVVRAVAACHPFHVDCKERALSCWWLLCSAGFSAQLVVGVKLFPLASHCWCEMGPFVLSDAQDRCQDFTPIISYKE